MIQILFKAFFDYLKEKRKWIIFVLLFSVLWRSLFIFTDLRNLYEVDFLLRAKDPRAEIDHLSQLLMRLFIPLVFTQVAVSISVGLHFRRNEKVGKRDSQSGLLPYFLLVLFALILFALAPQSWGLASELFGLPIVFCIGVLPAVSFIAARRCGNPIFGCVLGASTALLVLAVGLLTRNSIPFKASYMKPIIEVSCLLVVCVLITFIEERRKTMARLTFGLGLCLSVLVWNWVVGLNNQKKELNSLLSNVDTIVTASQEIKAQCEKFREDASPLLEQYPDLIVTQRRELETASKILTQYPYPNADLTSLIPLYEKATPGLGELMVVEEVSRIYRCDVGVKFDMQKVLLNTIAQKPKFLISKDFSYFMDILWESLQKSTSALGTFVEAIMDIKILVLLSEHKLIDPRTKADILELNQYAESSLESLRRNNAILAFKRPTPERIHLYYENLREELRITATLRAHLMSVMRKIEQL